MWWPLTGAVSLQRLCRPLTSRQATWDRRPAAEGELACVAVGRGSATEPCVERRTLMPVDLSKLNAADQKDFEGRLARFGLNASHIEHEHLEVPSNTQVLLST